MTRKDFMRYSSLLAAGLGGGAAAELRGAFRQPWN